MARKPKAVAIKIPAWVQPTISLGALFVSIFAVSLSVLNYQNSERYNEISIRPHLVSGGSIFEPDSKEFFLFNRGSGPANLADVAISHRGQPVSQSDFDSYFRDWIAKNGPPEAGVDLCNLTFDRNLPHVWIDPKAQRTFMSAAGNCDQNVVMSFLIDLAVSFEYSSDSGQLYRMEFGSASSETAAAAKLREFTK